LEEEWQQRSQRDRARAGRQRERPSRRWKRPIISIMQKFTMKSQGLKW
jgi:hypothetical protein